LKNSKPKIFKPILKIFHLNMRDWCRGPRCFWDQ